MQTNWFVDQRLWDFAKMTLTRVESSHSVKTWLESSRVTIFLNVTPVESESPKIVTRVKSSRVIDSSHAITSCRFAQLVKSLQLNRKVQCRSYCRQMLTLFELFGVAFLFIWCGNGVPTPLFLALHSCTWPLQPIVFKWRQNSPSTGFASWSRIDTSWMRCASLGPVMLINRKFDISCKLDISRILSTVVSQLHKKANKFCHTVP